MPVRQLTPAEAAEAIAAGAVVLDVRDDDEWEAGRLPDSLHIPLGELGARIGELPAGAALVVVCRSGSRSDIAAQGLARFGREDCDNLAGGLQAWAADGRPLEPDGAGVVV